MVYIALMVMDWILPSTMTALVVGAVLTAGIAGVWNFLRWLDIAIEGRTLIERPAFGKLFRVIGSLLFILYFVYSAMIEFGISTGIRPEALRIAFGFHGH